MATKRKVTRGGLSGKKAPARVKLKADIHADLAQAIQGKDNFAHVLRLNDDRVVGTVRRYVSTRSLAINKAVGGRGFPCGRLIEIYGQTGCGKTTLVQHVMAEVQATDGVVTLFEPEVKLDKRYAANLGVDNGKVHVIEPEEKKAKDGSVVFSGERTIEAGVEATRRTLDFWMEKGGKGLLAMFWDSIASAATEEEMANPHTAQPGVAARELRRAMRKLMGKVARSDALWVVVNQQYEKIGGFSRTPGVKRSTYGGGGIPYHASLRLELIVTGQLKDTKGNVVGVECLCKVMKNHLSGEEGSTAPAKDEAFAIQWGRGICNAWTLLEKLKANRYIQFGGGWYTYQVSGGQPVQWQGGWQGLEALLTENPALYAEMANVYNNCPGGV
jgi:recombination protein RecA